MCKEYADKNYYNFGDKLVSDESDLLREQNPEYDAQYSKSEDLCNELTSLCLMSRTEWPWENSKTALSRVFMIPIIKKGEMMLKNNEKLSKMLDKRTKRK